MTAKLIRRTVPSPNFDTTVNMLLMDELEAVIVSTTAPSSGFAVLGIPFQFMFSYQP
jgi:hypothetical protein